MKLKGTTLFQMTTYSTPHEIILHAINTKWSISKYHKQTKTKAHTFDIKRHMLLSRTPSDTTSRIWHIDARKTAS